MTVAELREVAKYYNVVNGQYFDVGFVEGFFQALNVTGIKLEDIEMPAKWGGMKDDKV